MREILLDEDLLFKRFAHYIEKEQKRIISFLRVKNETGQNFTVMRF